MLSDTNPLEQVRRLSFLDTPRNRWYSQQIDLGLEQATAGFDWNKLPYADQADQSLRYATAVTGMMAFCWANPWSRHYQDPRLLKHVIARLLEFAATQDGGSITFGSSEHDKTHYTPSNPIRESHGNSWYLEPLILAAVWVSEQLTAPQRKTIDAMIRRSSDMHAAIPLNETNNRGVIRQAVLALSGAYLKDPRLIDIAIRDFHREPVRVFNEKDGQINEGTGPDGNYSGTTFIYLYLYRVFSADSTIDYRMIDALKWFTWISDPKGIVTLFGASTRLPMPQDWKVNDFLPAMERYAARVPHFSWLIDHGYLQDKFIGVMLHCVCPLIWCMLEHQEPTGHEDPDWFNHNRIKRYNPKAGPEWMYTNEGYATLYFVFKKDYHATTTCLGRSPYKGFQHWSYKQEAPVIWPTISHPSRSVARGIDTAHFNASGVKFRDKMWYEGPPSVLLVRFENIWHHYLLTQSTLLLLISSGYPDREDIWVINSDRCGQGVVAPGLLQYPGRRGRMHFAQMLPTIKILPNAQHLIFKHQGRTHLYAFSNESFSLQQFDPAGDLVRFSDDTGRYELQYEVKMFDPDEIRNIGYSEYYETGNVRTRAIKLD